MAELLGCCSAPSNFKRGTGFPNASRKQNIDRVIETPYEPPAVRLPLATWDKAQLPSAAKVHDWVPPPSPDIVSSLAARKSSVLDSLLIFDEADVVHIVQLLFEEKPNLLRHFSFQDKAHITGPVAQNGDLLNNRKYEVATSLLNNGKYQNGFEIPQMPRAGDLSGLKRPELAQVQFTAPMFFTVETDDCATIELMRIGTAPMIQGVSACVSWRTISGSAVAGEKFVAASGQVQFKPGEVFAQLSVRLIPNDDWDPTLDFSIVLEEEGIQNLELHRTHMHCRVKLIDDDAFPTSKFKAEVQANKVAEIPAGQLMMEYFRMNFKNKVVHKGSVKCLLHDFLINLMFMVRLVLKVWMINNLFMPVLSGDEEFTTQSFFLLVMVGLAFLVPEHLLHVLTYRRNYWKVGGGSRKILQANLIRKYMTFTEVVRDHVDHGEMILVLFKAIPDLVGQAYSGVFPIVKDLTLLLMLLFYQTVITKLMGLKTAEPKWIGVNCGVLAIFPLVMLTGLMLRTHKSSRLMAAAKDAEIGCTSYTIDMLNNFHLLADYGNRGKAVTQFEDKIKTYNQAFSHNAAFGKNNEFITKSLTIIICFGWIIFGGVLLADGQIAMGTFLANWSVFEQIGSSWGDIQKHLLDIQDAFTDLKTIVRLMNFPTENAHEKDFVTMCDEKGRAIAASMTLSDDDIAVDLLPIRMYKVDYGYTTKSLLSNVTVDFQQGLLHVIAGRRGLGKTTMLKLIGARHVFTGCEKGFFVMPAHLKVLHVSKEPLFFSGTLYDNLTYGVNHGDKEGSLERVLGICRDLDLKEDVLSLISDKADAEINRWNDVLSRSDVQLLNMARGLVTNPEVLCIHKPSMGLGPNTVPVVFDTLKQFVVQRGTRQDASRYYFRRPRTCIFTFTTDADLGFADKVHYPLAEVSSSVVPVHSVSKGPTKCRSVHGAAKAVELDHTDHQNMSQHAHINHTKRSKDWVASEA